MRAFRTVAAWLVVVPGAVFCLARLFGWDTFYPATQLMAYAPYAAVAAAVPVAVALLLRQWTAAGAAGLVVVLLAVPVLPRMTADGAPGADGRELRVMSANLLAGAADPVALAALVREQHVDVLVLQEYTPSFAAAFTTDLPYRVAYAERGVFGSAVYSRFPLEDDGLRINPPDFGQARAVMTIDGRRIPIESVHTRAPGDAPSTQWWGQSFAVQPPADPDGPPRILAGDFNATLEHSPMRALLATGYRDAADVLGLGLTPTWPYDGRRLPPVTIDHVLADRRIGVRAFEAFRLPGSDHRPILAVLTLPA
jgi:endonuclease/exonuclease/phosphatase (EEP) superfamily protein YafD